MKSVKSKLSSFKRQVLKELFTLLSNYNCHYGEIDIYKSKYHLYIKIYNGGCSFGLQKAKIPFEVVGHSEIKQSVIQIYNRNHQNYFVDRNGEVDGMELIRNYGDITKINPHDLPDFDLISGGFPCQDVSLAGLRDLSKGRTTKTKFSFITPK